MDGGTLVAFEADSDGSHEGQTMTALDEGLLRRLEQTLAAERTAWPYGDEGGDFVAHRAAQRKALEVLQEVGSQDDIATIIESEIAWLNNELEHHAPSLTQTTFLESALDDLRIVREHWTEVMSPECYAFLDSVFRLKECRLGAVPNDQIRQALRNHLAKLTDVGIGCGEPLLSALYDQRRKNIDRAERLYTDRQHAVLGVEPADTTLPGCLLKIHVAHPDTGEPWQVIEWNGKRIEASLELATRGGILLRDWESQLAVDRAEGLGLTEDEAGELVGLVEDAGFDARAEILVTEEEVA